MTVMIAYTKWTSLACNLRDGEAIKLAKKNDKDADLKTRERAFALENIPSLYSFIAY